MKNGRIVLLSTLIVSMLLLASCTDGGGEGQVFQGGTQGLLLRFVEGTPPSLVYDNNAADFELLMQVENAGEFDVDKIHFTISGISPNDFPGGYKLTNTVRGWVEAGPNSELGRDSLAGKTRLERNVIPGDTTYITLADGLRYSRELLGGGELRYTVMADACYPYATLATSTICLQRDYLDGNDNICSPRAGGEVSVSGAPLQVTGFTQTAVGRDRLRVQYTFELKSNAEIWAPKAGNAQTCDPVNRGDRIREEGVFYVEIDDNSAASSVSCIGFRDGTGLDGTHIKSIPQITLSPITGNAIVVRAIQPRDSGYLKLVDGKATLTCTLNFGDSGVSTNSLGTVNILAGYYVRDSARATFSVTHSGTGSGTGTGTSGSGTGTTTGGTQGGAQLINCAAPTLTSADCPNMIYTAQFSNDPSMRQLCEQRAVANGC